MSITTSFSASSALFLGAILGQQVFSSKFNDSRLGTVAGGALGGIAFTFLVIAVGNFKALFTGGAFGWLDGELFRSKLH